MDLSRVFKGSLVKVIAELRTLIPKDQFEATVKKFIPDGLDGIENFKYESVKRKTVENDVVSNKKQRIFDISKYRRRHIALRIFYDGSKMGGFAQHDSCSLMEGMADDNSVETAIFSALKRVNLIDDVTKCRYNRCGRTDAGVSAFNQVISIYLRSNLRSGVEFVDEFDPEIIYNPPNEIALAKKCDPVVEFDYPAVLNKVLPQNIRITGWCPVDRDFSARFSCCGRVYRYYFLRREYDIEKLNYGLRQLEGEHDFRNFCRIDTVNVCDFNRAIFQGDVVVIQKGADSAHDVMAVEIIGRAFLWHQIRCIMSVLFLVGSGREDASIIADMLDIKKLPYKPQYQMADPEPLVLYDCIFNPGENAIDSRSKCYYDIIASNPLYKPIVESNHKDGKSKYNTNICCFDNSLSTTALRELAFYGESRLYDAAISSARYQELFDDLKTEYKHRKEDLPDKCGDYKEVISFNYTPFFKRSKAPSYEERIMALNDNSLKKLQNRYQYVDLEQNDYIPDVIKEKLASSK